MRELGGIQDLIARRILQERKHLRLSQDELAEKCGLPRSTIARLESGQSNPSLDVMVQICRALDLAVAELLSPPASQVRFFEASEVKKTYHKEDKLVLTELDKENYLLELEPDGLWIPDTRFRHTHKRIFCEYGHAYVIFETQMIQLQSDEMIEFQSEQKFRISAHGKKTKLIILPTGSQHPTPQLKEELR